MANSHQILLIRPIVLALILVSAGASVEGAIHAFARSNNNAFSGPGDSGVLMAADSHTFLLDGGAGGMAVASAFAGLDPIASLDDDIRLKVSAIANWQLYAQAFASWTDTITVQSNSGYSLPDYLIFRVVVDGSIAAKLSTDLPFGAYARFDLGFSSQFGVDQGVTAYDIYRPAVIDDSHVRGTTVTDGFEFSISGFPEDDEFFGVFDFVAPLRGNNSFYYAISSSANVSSDSIPQSTSVDFFHTSTFAEILLPDGSTPESQGFTLTFESGVNSPNLVAAAVPEPASLALWSLGALGCAIAGYRRRHFPATHS